MSRVLVVTNDFPPRQGGIETFVYSLCQELEPEQVIVYTARMEGSSFVDEALPFRVVRDPSRVLLPSQALARRVTRVLRGHGCDRVLIGSSMPLGLLAPSLRRAGAQRIVAMTHGHEVWWARLPVTRAALSRVAKEVDVLTFVSEWCRDRIAPALRDRDHAKMHRLSPGLNPTVFRPDLDGSDVRHHLGIRPDQPVILCVARMTARKGQDVLVQALPEVRSRSLDAELVLVGDGPDRARVERLAERHGVADAVHFVGGVPHQATAAYFAAADVFAMPCRTRRFGLEPEAFGIVFLEAQACGLPVLIGRSGGAPETLRSSDAGAVVEPGATRVAEALHRLLTDPRARHAAAECAEDFAALHSWAQKGEQLRRYLKMF